MGRVRQESPLHGDGLGDARQKPLDRDDERPDLGRQARHRGSRLQSASERSSRSSAMLFNGVSILRIVTPITSGRRTIRLKSGATVRSALLFAISLRTAVCWPTAMRRPPSWLLMTNRQGTPPMATVWRPSGASALRPGAAPSGCQGLCGCSGQDNEPRLRICVRRSGRLDRGSREALSLRQRGRLAELIVLQLDGFAERVPIGEEARRNCDQDDGQR